MSFFKNKPKRVLILTMGTLFIFAFIGAHFYYKYENESVDPRVINAIQLYEKYNMLAEKKAYDDIINLMDSIESIYMKYELYANSYEIGVLNNNKAATYISMSISPDLKDSTIIDSLLEEALFYVDKSIDIYSKWLNEWGNKSKEDIKKSISPYFLYDSTFANSNVKRFINKRVKEIIEAQSETQRRLSVSYTNLGIIYRHKLLFDDAVNAYIKALELWPDNLSAENNLNVLLGKEQKKRSIWRQIFPKNRIQ